MKKNIIPFLFVTLVFGSCKMGHYYASKRISHEEITTENSRKIETDIHQPNHLAPVLAIIKDSSILSENHPGIITAPRAKNEVIQQEKSTKHISRMTYQKLLSKKTTVVKQPNVFYPPAKAFNGLKATKNMENWFGILLVAGIAVGIVAAIVSGSAGIGFLVAAGIVLLVLLGIGIGMMLIIWCIFGLIGAMFKD